MRRLVPPKTKEHAVIIFGFTLIDILILLMFIAILYVEAICNYNNIVKLALLGVTAIITILSMTSAGDQRGYVIFAQMIRFVFKNKKVESIDFKNAVDGKIDGKLVNVPEGYKSMAIEISGVDFGILTEGKQDRLIQQLSGVFKKVKFGKIVKIDRPLNVANYIEQNETKIRNFEAKRSHASENNERTNGFDNRIDILSNANNILNYVQNEEAITVETFYLIAYDISEDALVSSINSCVDILNNMGIENKILSNEGMKELYQIFYEAEVTDNFQLPTIREHATHIELDGEDFRIASLGVLPVYCDNAWLWEIFSIPGTKVTMNFNNGKSKTKVLKAINKTMVELQSRYVQKGATESMKLDIQNSIDALGVLLQQLKMDNELLHEVDYYIIYPADRHKDVDEVLRSNNIFMDKLIFKQLDAYMEMNLFTPGMKHLAATVKNINSTTLAAGFPFVSKAFLDPHGNYIGDNRYPVFFDLFHSWNQSQVKKRTNANMCVFGKTGGGKSYFMKKIMMQQACDGAKVFILDPDNEYQHLCTQLDGNLIDVGGLGTGVINPLQVFPTLREDGNLDYQTAEVSDHRVFLQEWFKVVAPNLDSEAEPFLNQAIARTYNKFKISDDMDVSKIPSDKFPTMDDLYQTVEDEFNRPELMEYDRLLLRKLKNVLDDFRTGGVHAKLWNGHTTFKITNPFTVLNFQSLFSNSNMKVANGQMLLILRYLMQEVIKNRNVNNSTGDANNIVICIDEAHRFINQRFPIALTFMSDMVKRIRKYGGSMIVATQNIKDFVGQSEETRVQASNVINGCQYSVIFGLMADDVNSVTELYRSYNGGLTETEINFLTEAERGNCLFMVDSDTRFITKISLFDGEEKYIEPR